MTWKFRNRNGERHDKELLFWAVVWGVLLIVAVAVCLWIGEW